MKGTFFCSSCNLKFETEGNKVEYRDPIYGPCFKYTAECPHCKEQVGEFREKKVAKNTPVSSCQSCQHDCPMRS
ncbi:MAG: hypothetical protein V2A54_15310 [Bacteroidota bacterium]